MLRRRSDSASGDHSGERPQGVVVVVQRVLVLAQSTVPCNCPLRRKAARDRIAAFLLGVFCKRIFIPTLSLMLDLIAGGSLLDTERTSLPLVLPLKGEAQHSGCFPHCGPSGTNRGPIRGTMNTVGGPALVCRAVPFSLCLSAGYFSPGFVPLSCPEAHVSFHWVHLYFLSK